MIHFFFFRSRRSIVRSPGASQRKAQGWATTPARNRKRPHRRQTRKKGAQHRGVPQARRGSRRDHASNRPQARPPQRGKPTQSGAVARATIQRPCTKGREKGSNTNGSLNRRPPTRQLEQLYVVELPSLERSERRSASMV